MSGTELIDEFPKRLKVFLVFVVFVFIFGYFSLVLIEGMSFIDALYFLIVTVSTVGFGDITPTTSFAKVIVSILIVISISSIALLSEQVVSRLVILNTSKRYDLPTSRLEYKTHIVICGFTRIAENISLLFRGRFFRVVVLDPHEVAVQRARNLGFEAYLGRPELKSTLQTVNISKAMALYLFMDDENKNVLTSIQGRSLNPDLLIYASTDHELSIELGNLIGINRTYHYERIVASNINFSLQPIIAFALPNQLLSDEAEFFQVLVRKEFPYKERFDHYYPVGMLDKTLTNFTPMQQIDDQDQRFAADDLLMLTIPREHVEKHLDESMINTPIFGDGGETVDTVIIGGYNPTARHIIHELDPSIVEDFTFKVLTFSQEDAKLAESDGYEVIYCHREEFNDRITKMQLSSTLLVNLFDRLTDSLMVNTVIRRLGVDILILQLAFNRLETDVLIRSGADRILIPDVLMSRGMFLILLSTKNYINSMIWGNGHIFEHVVDKDSPLRGKKIGELKNKYNFLLYQDQDGKILTTIDADLTIEEGTHVLLHRDLEILRVSDEFVENVHH